MTKPSQRLRFASRMGEEIAVAQPGEKGEPTAPLILAELKNPAGFSKFGRRKWSET